MSNLILLLFLFFINPDPKRFEKDIIQFEKEDSVMPPPKEAVLFIGSSSIVLWKTLKNDFPEIQMINRGFGGSHTHDLLYYFNRIVIPYKPKLIVYYAGTNDIAKGTKPEVIAYHTERFIQKVDSFLPGSKVIVLSNTLAVRRKHLVNEFNQTNLLLQEMIKKYPNAIYTNVSKNILNEKGMPRPECFVSDSLHLSPIGYNEWKNSLAPVLNQLYNP